MNLESTATPIGSLRPVIKLLFAPPQLTLALPILVCVSFVQ
jgi:hypothetical protein